MAIVWWAVARCITTGPTLSASCRNTCSQSCSDQGPARNTLNTNKANQVGDTTGTNLLGWTQGLRGGKHEIYEGHVRIPFVVRWPGNVPASAVNDTRILSGLDFLPTLCRLTGTAYGQDQFEGVDVSDVWLGGDPNPNRFLYWAKQWPVGLDRNWKYHENKQTGDELYNLANDPNESTNIIAKHLEPAASMLKCISAWYKSLPSPPRKPAPPSSTGNSGNPTRHSFLRRSPQVLICVVFLRR